MQTKLSKFSCEIVFAGDATVSNPNGCAFALEEAGYQVVRMRPQHYKMMAVPGDEFMEAIGFDTDADIFWEKVSKIVGRYGGDAQEYGAIDDTYVPLKFLIDQESRMADQS